MAKYYGMIGYAETHETVPGVFVERIIERPYMGDVLKMNRSLEGSDKVNNDVNINNSISIVSDAYAYNHIFAMRYVTWLGSRWVIKTVEVDSPRLTLSLGGIYNGPTPEEQIMAP